MSDQSQQAQEQVKLENLDIFSLLKLEHLTPEQKADRLLEIEEIVLNNFFQEDLPTLVSKEDLEEFRAMTEDQKKTGAELEGWLRQKVPGFDQLLLAKTMAAKKELVKQNILTRLDVVSLGLSQPELQKDQNKLAQFTKEKETLDKIIAAIDSDDWGQASSLIASL